MAGLVPAIHVFGRSKKTWITGTSPVMTVQVVQTSAKRGARFSILARTASS
jgi:hypothetical protein